MSLNEFLTLATQATLVAIAAITFVSYLLSRDKTRLDISLLFAALAFIVLLQLVQLPEEVSEGSKNWQVLLTQIAFMAHPYLLLRLVLDFRQVPARFQWFAIGGMIISWAALILIPPPLPTAVTLAMVIYFLIVELYAAAAFILGARATAGVTHWRLMLAAAGSGFLALVIFNSGLSVLIPSAQPLLSTVSQFSGLFAMLSYYAGFATPHWLRRYWQLLELQRFMRQTAGPWTGEPIISTLERLCHIAVRSVGGMAAMVVLWDEEENKLVIRASTNAVELPSGRAVDSQAIWEAWESQHPITGLIPADFKAEQAPIALSLKSKATMIVPISTKDHTWGILQVFNRRNSLFMADDINLIALFAEQTAIALGYASLITEQQNLIRQLSWQTGQLEAAYKELESFSYSVSHDLRSPLRHISGYMELLLKHIDPIIDQKGRRYISITLKEAGRMSRLIDDLLAFSRFGRLEMHQVEVNLNQLIQELIEEFEHETSERDIQWRIHPLPRIRSDRSMIRLVWTNLIGNALKFTRFQPQTEIEIGCRSEQDEMVFYISDNGAGFNMKYVGQMFGVFQRLHQNNEFEGTGIGLATVHRIIQRHGGRTWADGEEGEGATFYFTLPLENAIQIQPITTSAAAGV